MIRKSALSVTLLGVVGIGAVNGLLSVSPLDAQPTLDGTWFTDGLGDNICLCLGATNCYGCHSVS